MAADGKQTEPLSSIDAAWLRMEHPTNLMVVTVVLIFDQPLDFERLREVVERRLLRFDRFRQRLVSAPAPWVQPRWEFDPNFTLSAHLHRIALPAPGDRAALEALVSDLMSTPLDHSKPLWQFHLIENFGGGCVLLPRLHHCIADGVALVHVLLSLAEAEQDDPASTGTAAGRPKDDLDGLLSPARALELLRQGAGVAEAVGKLLLLPPDPPTPLRGALGVAKRAVWSEPIPLEDVKAVGRAVGGTVNDVLLTAAAGALRRYLQARGAPVDALDVRAVVPVNLRPPGELIDLGNRFGLIFLTLPVSIDDPLDRLFELRARMEEIKRSPEALVMFSALGVLGMTPAEIEQALVQAFGRKATAVITNVPGPRETICLAGRPVREIMFWVPQSGWLGLGLSILSYAGSVTLGIASDVGLVPDPEAIIAGFQAEFSQYREMVRQAAGALA